MSMPFADEESDRIFTDVRTHVSTSKLRKPMLTTRPNPNRAQRGFT